MAVATDLCCPGSGFVEIDVVEARGGVAIAEVDGRVDLHIDHEHVAAEYVVNPDTAEGVLEIPGHCLLSVRARIHRAIPRLSPETEIRSRCPHRGAQSRPAGR